MGLSAGPCVGPDVSRAAMMLRASLSQDLTNLTDEQQRIVEALRELMQPIAHMENPGCCPCTLVGLKRMWRHNRELYSVVADYHGWPTNLANVNQLDGKAFCKGAVSFTTQFALRRHVDALAGRAPPFYTPPTNAPTPVEDDDEDELSDDDDDTSRNLQAHVVLQQVLTDAGAA